MILAPDEVSLHHPEWQMCAGLKIHRQPNIYNDSSSARDLDLWCFATDVSSVLEEYWGRAKEPTGCWKSEVSGSKEGQS